jgi:hypothetical protein
MPTPTENSALPQGVPQPTVEGYEKSDLPVKWIFGFFALLFLGGVVVQAFIAWQLSDLRGKPPRTDQWPAARPGSMMPPGNFPTLQVSPPTDLEAFRAREEAELNSYGWVNRTAGVARIPIGVAMDLLLQKGLPVRQATNNIQAGKSNLELQRERPLRRESETGGNK